MKTNYLNALLPGWQLLNPPKEIKHNILKTNTNASAAAASAASVSDGPTFYFLHLLEEDLAPIIQIIEKIPSYLSIPAQEILEKIIFQLTKDLKTFIEVKHIVVSSQLKELFSPETDKVIPQFNIRDVLFPMGTQATKILIKDSQPLHLIHSSLKTTMTEYNSQEITLNIVPLFHPEMLTINTSLKRPTWESLKHTIPLLVELVTNARPL
ncbi:MAG: hypothetical protein QE271_14035 [Bacteriovoracaceae bacterium]|nr:hypothetical protein [Bacteriovoracaceae bacterium]